MADWTLTKLRLVAGQWQGLLRGGSGTPPELVAEHLGQPLPGLQVTPDTDGAWRVDLPIPASVIADGAHCVVIRQAEDMRELAVIVLMAGEDLAHDLRGEVAMLRAELDLLKRAFRRHCAETL